MRQTVFASALKPIETVQPLQQEALLQSSASVFLHYFIHKFAHEARVYDPKTKCLQRIDSWALSTAKVLPVSLAQTLKQVSSVEKRLTTRFVFFDQELWVLDFELLANVSKLDAATSRIAKLIQHLDGYSLCFPSAVYPKDLGASMNSFAKEMVENRDIKKPAKAPVGRPNKIDRVVEVLERLYPNGTGGELQKVVLRTVKADLKETLGMSTLRSALEQISQ